MLNRLIGWIFGAAEKSGWARVSIKTMRQGTSLEREIGVCP